MTDTIFALSSGRPPSGVAVIRISGPAVADTLRTVAGAVPDPRCAALRRLRSPDGLVLDHALVLFFPAPRSETGEDCGELQLHGGRAVVAKVLDVLASLPGLRMAEPGEFIRRAFLNGKLDLIGVEALGDLVSAETEMQRRFAIESSGAAQSALYARWRTRLLHARAMIEAELDFSDEGDVAVSVAGAVWVDVASLIDELDAHIGGYRKSEMIRDGFHVVLVGPPNAGKSSLLNALARRDVAIVSDEPGTTRDVVEVRLDLGGIKVVVSDTAGLREGASGIEAIGIARTRERIGGADLLVLVESVEGAELAEAWPGPALSVSSKADLATEDHQFGDSIAVSAFSGRGLGDLLDAIRLAASDALPRDGDVLPTRLRQVELFRDARAALVDALDQNRELELRAESLRIASDRLGQVVGNVGPEELLDVIFGQFCIGK